jgi:hypothetical protein
MSEETSAASLGEAAAAPPATDDATAPLPFVVTPGQLCVFNMKKPCRDGDNCCLVHATASQVCDNYGFDGFCPDGASCTAEVHVEFMPCESSKESNVPEEERCQQRTKMNRWCSECSSSFRRKPKTENSNNNSVSIAATESASSSQQSSGPPRWRPDRYQAPTSNNQEPWQRVVPQRRHANQSHPQRGNNRTFHAPGRHQFPPPNHQQHPRGRDFSRQQSRDSAPLLPQRQFRPPTHAPSLPPPSFPAAPSVAASAPPPPPSSSSLVSTGALNKNRFALPAEAQKMYTGLWADAEDDE